MIRVVRGIVEVTKLTGVFPFRRDSSLSPLSLGLGALLTAISSFCLLFTPKPSSFKAWLDDSKLMTYGLLPWVVLLGSFRGKKRFFRTLDLMERLERELKPERESRSRFFRTVFLMGVCMVQFVCSSYPPALANPKALFHPLPQLLGTMCLLTLLTVSLAALSELLEASSSKLSTSPRPCELIVSFVALSRAASALNSSFNPLILHYVTLIFVSYYINVSQLVFGRGTDKFFLETESLVARLVWLWLTLSTGLIFCHLLAASCTRLARKGEEFIEALYRLSQRNPAVASNAKVRLVLRARPKIKFTACHLFTVDNTLIHSMNAAIIMYIVVMLQLS